MVALMESTSRGSRRKVATYLNRPKLDELRRANGIQTEVELARIIGVNAATLWSASEGRPVSGTFIAGVILAFPHASLDSLFSARSVEDAA